MTSARQPHVVAMCGSLRTGSHTYTALRHVLDAAETAGATTDIVDLRTLELPIFDPDRRDAGASVALRCHVREADAIVLGTPTYHGSYASR